MLNVDLHILLFHIMNSFLCQGGSVSVHPEDIKLLGPHSLSDQTESDGTPPIPPPEATDTIDGKLFKALLACFAFFCKNIYLDFSIIGFQVILFNLCRLKHLKIDFIFGMLLFDFMGINIFRFLYIFTAFKSLLHLK
jgi:hypothetical protein